MVHPVVLRVGLGVCAELGGWAWVSHTGHAHAGVRAGESGAGLLRAALEALCSALPELLRGTYVCAEELRELPVSAFCGATSGGWSAPRTASEGCAHGLRGTSPVREGVAVILVERPEAGAVIRAAVAQMELGVEIEVAVAGGELLRRADGLARLAGREGADAAARSGVLHIGTDGSRGRLRGAWAWVDSSGRAASGECGRADALGCELQAVAKALRAHRQRDLVVHVDSRPALEAIASYAQRGGGAAGHAQVCAKILSEAAGREVTLRWVRGHSEDVLNDAADRLAVLARRHAEGRVAGAGLSAASRRQITETILSELREEIALRPPRPGSELQAGAQVRVLGGGLRVVVEDDQHT